MKRYVDLNFLFIYALTAIAAAARSTVGTASVLTNAGVVASDPSREMDACVHLFCLCCPMCRQRPCDRLIPHKGVLPKAYII
jgi:hypothetical protein